MDDLVGSDVSLVSSTGSLAKHLISSDLPQLQPLPRRHLLPPRSRPRKTWKGNEREGNGHGHGHGHGYGYGYGSDGWVQIREGSEMAKWKVHLLMCCSGFQQGFRPGLFEPGQQEMMAQMMMMQANMAQMGEMMARLVEVSETPSTPTRCSNIRLQRADET
jgi:hypothetical protein